MSRIKEMAREVARKGEDSRGTLIAQGKPRQIYEWWLRHTKPKYKKVGLCSYFWIVVLWAPLLATRLALAKVFKDGQFWLCMSLASAAILICIGIAYPGQIGIVLVWIIACIAAFVGFILGIISADYLQDKSGYNDVSKRSKGLVVAFMVLTAPAAMVGFAVGMTYHAFASKRAIRFYRWAWNARLVNGYVSPLLAVVLIGFVVMTYYSVLGGWWMLPLILASLVIAWFAGKQSIVMIGTSIEARRDMQRDEQRRHLRQVSLRRLEPLLRCIFEGYYGKQASEELYWRWYGRYVIFAEAQSQYGAGVWAMVLQYGLYELPDVSSLPSARYFMANEILYAIQYPDDQPSIEPDVAAERVQRMSANAVRPFVIMGDFVVLLAKVIVAWKKKFCPIVEFPDN